MCGVGPDLDFRTGGLGKGGSLIRREEGESCLWTFDATKRKVVSRVMYTLGYSLGQLS